MPDLSSLPIKWQKCEKTSEQTLTIFSVFFSFVGLQKVFADLIDELISGN